MLRGVVIWYQKAEFKALIWCEDSGALAFVTGPTSWRNPMVDITVGDYVGFTAVTLGRERRCSDVHLIASQVAPDLSQSILGGCETKPLAKTAGSFGPVLSLCAESPHAVPAERTGNPLLHLCASRD